MKINIFLLFALSFYLIFSEASVIEDQLSDKSEGELSSRGIYDAENKKFKCPFPFGSFSDPDDCEYYFICMAGVSVHKKCRNFHKFDILRRTCLPSIIAVCISGKDKTTGAPMTTTTTPSGDSFSCPSWMGTFPHPSDCSKYYTCMLYQAKLKTCPKSELFDAVKKSCKSADKVNCGDRKRPDSSTTTSVTMTVEITTTKTPTVEITTTKTPTEPDTIITTSSPDEITITSTELFTTTTDSPPTEAKPTGPPETDCDEDDVDCIIDETGDPENWFTCPADIGAYVHPSSNKLFIFCMNWIPSVRKCGMDLVFSEELSTCIEVKYLL